MRTTTSLRFKNLLGFALLVGLLTSISITFTNCGGNDDDPDPKDTTTTTSKFKAEFLSVNGVRYEANQIFKKVIKKNNSYDRLDVEFGPNYPFIEIDHERSEGGTGDSLVPREYIPASIGFTNENIGYEVGWYWAVGSAPNNCQYQIPLAYTPSVPNGKYTLSKIDGKYVSEFGRVELKCTNTGANGDDVIVIDGGYLIWKKK
jgi:hypothetical protein